MDYLIVFALGMFVATVMIRWLAQRAVDKFMENIALRSERRTAGELRINLEFDQNIYFVYDSDNGEFIAHNSDIAALCQQLVQRFPDRPINVVKGDAAAIKALVAELEIINENIDSVRSTP